MRIEGASRIVQKRSYVSPGEIKAVIGVAAPFYLTPLLAIGGVVSQCLYVLLLMVLLTILETLPLTVISLVPSVATAFIGLAEEPIPEEVDQQMDNVNMVGLLLLYVAVDLTPLWRRLSLWLLSWRGAPVKPLFAGLMAVAFTASLFLPGAFVTLVLAAFINRVMHNIEDHVIECLHERSQKRHASRQYSFGARMPGVDPSRPRNVSLAEPYIRRSMMEELRYKHRGVRLPEVRLQAVGLLAAHLQAMHLRAVGLQAVRLLTVPLPAVHLPVVLDAADQPEKQHSTPSAPIPSSLQQVTPMATPMVAPGVAPGVAPLVAPMVAPMVAPTAAAKKAPPPLSGILRATVRPSAALLSDTSLPTSPPKTVFKPFGCKPPIDGGIVSEIDEPLADTEPGKPSKRISVKSAFTTLHKALIVGVVYTSIVASECSYITGRTKRILDNEFRRQDQLFEKSLCVVLDTDPEKDPSSIHLETRIFELYSRDKESPMTTMVFLFFMFPMSAVTIVIFWAYIYRLYLRQVKPEMIAVVIFVAFVLTFALNAIGHFGITYTLTTYVLVVLVIGVPREFRNPFLADMSVTWPLIMAYMPWDMIIMRIGGTELAHLSRASGLVLLMSGVSTWIFDKVLVGNMRKMSPFWCQLVLLATTAVLAEVDTSFGFGSRVVPDMLQLADELQQNELYLALPVVMQSSYVLLIPYTSISLIFIHQYTDIEYTELLGLSIFVKVVSSVCLIFFSNTLNLSLPARATDLITVANATAP
ncbi:hypothetical protein HPB49_019549 [Dermacentor silvarum]|uniref:Uncharacterized protein n=1 Tax=Dermacentor silvarum TaxID=543639 RepID=A0ACB8D841_DERSI|nr:hypothetical protein HPB49_019549 [Dermacentor silvarum]